MDEQLMYDSTWLDEAVVQEAQIYPEALRQSKAERQPNFGGWMPQSQHEFNKLRDDTEQRKAMATKVGAYIGGGGIFKLHQQQEPQVQINFTGWSQGGICGIVTLDGKVFAFDWPLNEPIVLAQRLQWLGALG